MSPDKVFFLLQSKGKFLNQFANNDNLKAQADQVWRHLEGLTPILLGVMVLFGIGVAAYYYKPYNELPGRHYRVSHWLIAGVISFVLTFVATLCFEYFGIKTNLRTGLTSLYWLTALNNAVYCIIVYFITSVVWCNCFPTNAYKLFAK